MIETPATDVCRGLESWDAVLLAALALQVVHRIDRNGVATHGVDVVHGILLEVFWSPAGTVSAA
jgi:hypothetical protein